MMYIKFLPKFFFGFTAPLTDITISMSGIASRLEPIWAIVRRYSTLPMRIILAFQTIDLPLTFAVLTTKFTPALDYFTLLSNKFFATLQTNRFNPGISWMILANYIRRLPLSKAISGTKAPIFMKRFVYCLTTIFTGRRLECNNTELSMNIDSRRTFTGTIDSWISFIELECQPAVRAFFMFTACQTLALSRAKLLIFSTISRGKVGKFFSTLRARGGALLLHAFVTFTIFYHTEVNNGWN